MAAKEKAVVIGAGPMGLACGYELMKRDHEVLVLEADDRIGGMSASFDFDGLKIERFYHFICSTDYPLFEALEELELTDKLRWRETRMGFYYQGRLYEWGRPDCLLKFPHLDFLSKVRYALHVLHAKRIEDWTALDREEATSWIKRWIGRRAYNVLWEPLFRLKFHEYAECLSAAWIGTRIARVAKSRRSMFSERFGYLEGGSEIFVEALCSRMQAMGGQIMVKTPAQQLVTENGRVCGIVANGQRYACDKVISTVPLKYVPRFAPDLHPDELAKIKAIENIGVVCVLLKLKRPLTDYFWMNVNDASMPIPGIIEYTNLNPLQHNVLYVPYYMPKTHPRYRAESHEFIDEVISCIKRISPSLTDDCILSSRVTRYEFAQTVCTPDFFAKLPAIRTSLEGFFMADTSYYYPEDRSISESIKVGKKLAEIASVNT